MQDNWYGRDIVDLLASQDAPLDLAAADAGHNSRGTRQVILSRAGSRLGVFVTEHKPGDALKRLAAMLEYYPQPAAINGEEVERKEPPTGISVTRYDYSTDSASSYQVTHLGDADAPEPAFGFNTLIAGVRFQIHGHPLPWQLNYHIRQPGTGNRYWQRASELHCRALTPILAEELNEMETLSRSRGLQIAQTSALWARLRQQTMDRLNAAIKNGKAPPREEGDVYKMSLGHDPSYDEMHDGGAPIFVVGKPVQMDDGRATGAEYVTAAHALYQAEQKLVPVTGRPTHRHTATGNEEVAPNAAKEPDVLYVDAVTNGRSPEDQDRSFAPIANVADVTVHVGNNKKAVTVPASVVIEGQKYDVRVSYRQGEITPEKVSDLLCQAFWDQTDFNECPDAGEALADMESDYFEQAVAGMNSLKDGFSIQLQRMVDNLGTSVENPEEPMNVTSRDGRFTLTYNGRAASGAD